MSRGCGKRVILTTHGTLGDLHPYLAIALELQRRGHRPVNLDGQQCKRRACPSILLRCTPLAEDKYPKMGIGSEPSRANQRRLEELIDLYPRTVSDGHFAHVAD
ncbi:MAG: hypothetical protein DMG64_13990 [Acidobacteria bacterium]|nr:MAG: hypothetical protein DMG63_03515 [Acidobacteriota bacterium]PYY01540.1 MAG: hypothetical protein DMG64_13990 [Acidobacteriota bacterium]PYY24342.1 MAG: hypothetical protein DMG62_03360 [Acidobacteriota bacterium]